MNSFEGYALLIGVGEYIYSGLTSLPATSRDAKALASILSNKELCGYEPEKIMVLTDEDASKTGIINAYELLAKNTSFESTVFIYFSGHGGKSWENDQWKTFLCPREADPNNLTKTAISSDEFNSYIGLIRSKKMLIVLDACHAGGAAELKSMNGGLIWKAGLPDVFYEELGKGEGHVVIASSKEEQVSYLHRGGEYSLFTFHFIQAIKGGASMRGDGFIHVLDVFDYVNQAVQRDRPAQIPILKVRNLDLNFPIALDRRNNKSQTKKTTHDIKIIRELLIKEPLAGVKALSDYLDRFPEMDIKKNEVDLLRARLEKLNWEINLFGPSTETKSSLNQILFSLLNLCSEIEQETN